MRAVRAPLRSMIALVARVVPWMTIATSSAARPAADRIAATPSLTPCSGADGFVRTLVVLRRPSCSRATSVKVPPMSTAKRVRCISFLLSLGFSRPHVSNHSDSHAQRVARQIGERNILHLDRLDAALPRTGAHRLGLGPLACGRDGLAPLHIGEDLVDSPAHLRDGRAERVGDA